VSRDARPVAPPGAASAARSAAPLALLGLGRLAATRASAYAVPLDEYGRDWNFFCTLACVRLLAATPGPVRALLRRPRGGAAAAALAAAAVLGAHQAALAAGGAALLAQPERGADLLSQNREGLCSVVRARPRARATTAHSAARRWASGPSTSAAWR